MFSDALRLASGGDVLSQQFRVVANAPKKGGAYLAHVMQTQEVKARALRNPVLVDRRAVFVDDTARAHPFLSLIHI